MNLPPRFAALAVLAVGSIALAGCGSVGTRTAKVAVDTDASPPVATMNMATEAATTDAPTKTAATTTAAAQPVTDATAVTVELGKPNEYTLIPAVTTVVAGPVTFNVVNDGTMLHEMVVVKTDKTAAQLAQPDGTADEANSVGEAADIPAGATASVTLDLAPGHYVLLCNLPGHFAQGMYAEFTVTKPPTVVAAVAVELGKPNEYSLIPSVSTVPAGKVIFHVANDGSMLHEMVVVKTDKTAAQLKLANGEADETNSVGEAPDIKAGRTKSVTLDLTAGHYVLLCNLPGHFAQGMYAEFTVT